MKDSNKFIEESIEEIQMFDWETLSDFIYFVDLKHDIDNEYLRYLMVTKSWRITELLNEFRIARIRWN